MKTPQEVADDLIGTCDDFEKAAGEPLENFNAQWCAEFDTLAMLCDQCGWWVEASEMNDDQYCCECAEE